MLLAENILSAERVAEIERAAVAEMDGAVAFAESSPLPAPEEALEDLYATQD
jgi:pyruvate dehydrogenase E1 component alpha subunit